MLFDTFGIVFGRKRAPVLMSSNFHSLFILLVLLGHFVHRTAADKSKMGTNKGENRLGNVVSILREVFYFQDQNINDFHLIHKPKLIFELNKFKVPIIQNTDC